MFCENCGNKIADTARMCPFCGKVVMPVMSAAAVESAPAPKQAAVAESNAGISLADIDAEIAAVREENRVKKIKCYALIDVRVYIMGMVDGSQESASAKVVNAVLDGSVIPVYCEGMLEEYEQLLRRDRFKLASETVDNFIENLKSFGAVATKGANGEISVDTKGFPYYEIVAEKQPNASQSAVTPDEIVNMLLA